MTCIIPGCDKPAKKYRKYCSMHLSRIQRHGSPDIVLRSSSDQPFCSLRKIKRSKGTCYWVTIINGLTVYTHRLIGKYYLGRSLFPYEVVHHKDGNGLNNHPSNLQITDRSRHAVYHSSLNPLEEPF